jgi:LmbE family N-acetylglucosaminyl deacetylase
LAYSQNPSSGEIKQQIKKLGKLGSVLYFAAHPDDENTRIISYYANEKLYETAYFSLTRGDGGQNLIGDEKGDQLGVIRTQELLQARKIDGGKQYFSRAVDFGYSKTVEETLAKWNEDSILYDAVWVIREFQPDIIITRFPPDERAGHGHHTASAVVAMKAMDMAADSTVFPNQLNLLSPWQVKRLFINTGPWWEPNIDSLATANPEVFAKINVGEYSSILGESYTEIAGKSRSQHKTQGFGAALSKGNRWEYLELIKGEAFESSPMDGIYTGWGLTMDANLIQNEITKCYADFNEKAAWQSVEQLIKIRSVINENAEGHWKKVKTEEVNTLIQSCLGLVVEVQSENSIWVNGSEEELSFNILNRSAYPLSIEKIQGLDFDSTFSSQKLKRNEWNAFSKSIKLKNSKNSHPYWLREEHEALFTIQERNLTGQAEHSISPRFTFSFKLENNEDLTIEIPVIYKHVDRVKGELSHEVFISPAIIIHPSSDMILFKAKEKRTVTFQVSNIAGTGNAIFYPGLTGDWKGPEKIDVKFTIKGKPEIIKFDVEAPKGASEIMMYPHVSMNGQEFNKDQLILDYDHMDARMMLPKVKTKLLALDVTTNGEHIAYLAGAGDEIPVMLREMGYHITMISIDDLNGSLDQYDALIFGVRAFNVHPQLVNYHENILKYMEDGGRVVMQYNTSRGMDIPLGPYPFELSRDRVTDENATIDILDSSDPILNYPNKITAKDFENWVQERGLYFAKNWCEKYRSPLSWNDPNEDPSAGSLLVTGYGKGVYVYTSISFFRQLPAGVPGAYRLFSNIISGGKEVNKLEVNNKK